MIFTAIYRQAPAANVTQSIKRIEIKPRITTKKVRMDVSESPGQTSVQEPAWLLCAWTCACVRAYEAEGR